MARVYNFSAGPAALPQEVLEKAQKELVDYQGTGMSVMEMSHRSKAYMEIIGAAQANLRKLMNISDDYEVLFLQGGASMQFAMVPLNLFSEKKKADIINTGAWSKKAIAEAKRYGNINVVASSDDKNFSYIPKLSADMFDPEADYVHITTNNTIYGTLFPSLPDVGDVPLVADMSSNILSQVYDVNKFGVIYAGAQKNIGPAGLCIAIVRKDLIGSALDFTPTMLNYKTHADGGSMFNTPPTYGIYMAGLVFEWLLEKGGVAAMEKINKEKAAILYDFLDESKLFKATVTPSDRSIMNVPFVTGSDELDKAFIDGATAKGLTTLKGHRTVGGMRASIYNSMPTEGVVALVDFMKGFETKNS
ncbi:3-phosphoserine/phosphohydroxythreonine transaminase [Flammeovirgaceae bacterium SG7u.111]|nr:3-phosphoserine/phosphohydroxythreonine transaminase [Flammeovirgaceae bacterium SG7u.132]WPO38501.1 3-phosphoserine/phosphohydroxythreonine transaminase [Flammeovirgaceae bacterium SG7u.111]